MVCSVGWKSLMLPWSRTYGDVNQFMKSGRMSWFFFFWVDSYKRISDPEVKRKEKMTSSV